MEKYMKLSELLSESKEVTMLGHDINGEKVDKQTQHKIILCDVHIQQKGLTTLKYSPTDIRGSYICRDNELTSLEFGPIKVLGIFSCSDNKLTSLEHCPSEVGGSFRCVRNELTSLKDIHKQLTKMNGKFVCYDNPITSHILGVLLINGCSALQIDDRGAEPYYSVEKIINKYLPNKEGRKGLLKCKGELVDAGFDTFAQL